MWAFIQLHHFLKMALLKFGLDNSFLVSGGMVGSLSLALQDVYQNFWSYSIDVEALLSISFSPVMIAKYVSKISIKGGTSQSIEDHYLLPVRT
jgi:hypothetical protein